MTDLPGRSPRKRRCPRTDHRSVVVATALALLVLAPPAAAQVTRGGFVPQPPPGEKPVVYLQHAMMPGSDVTTLRMDSWGERWGAAVGGGFIHPDGDDHPSGGTLDLALMRSLREQDVALKGFGIQAQLGASVGRVGGDWTWEAPLTAGALWSLPAGTPLGFVQGHLWGDAGVRLRGGDDQATEAGLAAGVGVRLLGQSDAVRGWGAQVRGGLLHVDGATVGSVELGVSVVLVSRR